MAFHHAGIHQPIHHFAAFVFVPGNAPVQHPLVAEHTVAAIIERRTGVRKPTFWAHFAAFSSGLTSAAVRVPHTVHVKTLYCIGGQDYCRHHIIRAGVGPVVFIPLD